MVKELGHNLRYNLITRWTYEWQTIPWKDMSTHYSHRNDRPESVTFSKFTSTELYLWWCWILWQLVVICVRDCMPIFVQVLRSLNNLYIVLYSLDWWSCMAIFSLNFVAVVWFFLFSGGHFWSCSFVSIGHKTLSYWCLLFYICFIWLVWKLCSPGGNTIMLFHFFIWIDAAITWYRWIPEFLVMNWQVPPL